MTAPWRRLVATLLVVGALLAPAIRDRDSFPLSIYPMYAGTRGDEVEFVTAVGVDSAGDRHALSLEVIASTDDPLIASSRLRREVSLGRADGLCAEIAERASTELVAIEIAREQHDVLDRATGRESIRDRTVIVSCKVGR